MASIKFKDQDLRTLQLQGSKAVKLYCKGQLIYDKSAPKFYTLETPIDTANDSSIGAYEWTIYVRFKINNLPSTPAPLIETNLNNPNKVQVLLNSDGTLSFYESETDTTTALSITALTTDVYYHVALVDSFTDMPYKLEEPYRAFTILVNSEEDSVVSSQVTTAGLDMGNATGNFTVGGNPARKVDITVSKIELYNIYPDANAWSDIKSDTEIPEYFNVDLNTDKTNLILNGSFSDGLNHWVDLASGMYATAVETSNQLVINGQQMGPYLICSGGDIESSGLPLTNDKYYLWTFALKGAASFYFNSSDPSVITRSLNQVNTSPPDFTNYPAWTTFRRTSIFDFDTLGGTEEPWIHCFGTEDMDAAYFDEIAAHKLGKVASFTQPGFSITGTTNAKLIIQG